MSEKNVDLDQILNEFKDYAPIRSQRSQPAAPRQRQPEPETPAPEIREPVREEPQPEMPRVREPEVREPVRREPPRWLPVAITAALLLVSCLCLGWILRNVHPGSGTVVSTKPAVNLSRRADLQPGETQTLTPEPVAESQDPGTEDPTEPAVSRRRSWT